MNTGLLRIWGIISAALFVLAIGGIIGFLLYNALPHLSLKDIFGDTPPLEAVLHNAPVWDALWPAMAGTGRLLLLSMSFTVPLGMSTAIYLSEYAPRPVRQGAVALLELFSGVPSILMGLFGFLLILILRKTILPQAGTSLLLAAFCLSLLVLPVFALTFFVALQSIPHKLRVTAAAIGLSPTSAIWRVYLPQAGRGLASAFFLASGRCAEDTAVILMTGAIANASRAPLLTEKFEALPFFIYYTTANYRNEAEFLRIFVAAFLLLVLACVLLAVGRHVYRFTFNGWGKTV